MKTKNPKPLRAWMAWNLNNPWEDTVRRTRRDCWAAVKGNLCDPAKDSKHFTVRRVTVTAE